MMVDSGCSLYDDLEIQDMFILEDSKFIVIPVLTFTVRVSFLFTLFQHSKLDQDKISLTDLSLEGKWLVVGGCIEYVLCFPFFQTNNFEINVHNYLWPPLLRTTAIKLIN